MNALTLLKNDHKKVKSLMDEVNHTTKRAKKKRELLFQQISKEITIHTALEEKLLYPILKKHAKTQALALEAYEEHHVVDVILAEVKDVDASDERWEAKFSVLKENLLHHIKEEEKELFPKVKSLLEKEDLSSLGNEMENLKQTLLSEDE